MSLRAVHSGPRLDALQVLEVERLMDLAAEQERFYKKQLRTHRNWETAWLLMNTKPDELEEYVDLKVRRSLLPADQRGGRLLFLHLLSIL